MPSRQDDEDEDEDDGPWWLGASRQSDIGVLLDVRGNLDTGNGNGEPRITELLLYAAVVRDTHGVGDGSGDGLGIPTPPRSSSPVTVPVPVEDPATSSRPLVPIAKLYAQPLSSDLLYHASSHDRPIPRLSADDHINAPAHFLPYPNPKTATSSDTIDHRKRQKLDSLFDDATRQRRNKSTRRPSDSTSAPKVPPKPKPTTISRSNSLISLREGDDVWPVSRQGASRATRRGGLRRGGSGDGVGGPAPVPEEPNRFEQENKASLAKVVMAGMRIFGLVQHKGRGRRKLGGSGLSVVNTAAGSGLATTPSLVEMEDEADEYKLIYHHTYRSAAFALRKRMGGGRVGEEGMRVVVDRVLGLFCDDPLGGGGREMGMGMGEREGEGA